MTPVFLVGRKRVQIRFIIPFPGSGDAWINNDIIVIVHSDVIQGRRVSILGTQLISQFHTAYCLHAFNQFARFPTDDVIEAESFTD